MMFPTDIIIWQKRLARLSRNILQRYRDTRINIADIKNLLQNTNFNDYAIREADRGMTAEVFCLSKNNDKYYIRIVYSEDSIKTQVHVHDLLLKKGCMVPEIVEWQENCQGIKGNSYMIVTSVKGKPFEYHSNTFTYEQKNRILHEAGSQLARINSVPVKGFGPLCSAKNGDLSGSEAYYPDYVLRKTKNMLRELVLYNIISKNIEKNINIFIDENKKYLEQKDACLAHGDVCLDHIFENNGTFSGIIDFGDIEGASRYRDLADFNSCHSDIFHMIASGYDSIYKLPDDYFPKVKMESVLLSLKTVFWSNEHFPKLVRESTMLRYLKENFDTPRGIPLN